MRLISIFVTIVLFVIPCLSSATSSKELSYTVKLSENSYNIDQYILMGGDMSSRYYHLKSNNPDATKVIFIPDLARGKEPSKDLLTYVRNYSSYFSQILLERDIILMPGRVIANSTIHNCLLLVKDWRNEFSSWNGTSKGISRCLIEAQSVNVEVEMFSNENFAKDIGIVIEDFQLKNPYVWTVFNQSSLVPFIAEELESKLGGVIVDHPDLYMIEESVNSFDYFFETLDKFAKEEHRNWDMPNPPSYDLKRAIEKASVGEIYNGDVSNIAYNEDINRAFPLNGDSLIYYIVSKATNPSEIKKLANNDGSFYGDYAPFAISYYTNFAGFPEAYRACVNVDKFVDAVSKSPANVILTFERAAARRQAICSALGAPTSTKEFPSFDNLKVQFIIGGLDPYYSPDAFAKYQRSISSNFGVISYSDGSLSSASCGVKPRSEAANLVNQFINTGEAITQNVLCNWQF